MSWQKIKLMGGGLPTVNIEINMIGDWIEWMHKFDETWVLADYRRASGSNFVQWDYLHGPVGALP